MSFPSSFGSQLTAVMEALLKAVVAEVTALVEDGAMELRLELRDRDREIREKEREIEQRDRKILELRAAVDELRVREEAAVSPEEERQEERQEERREERQEETETCQQVWTKDDSKLMVKCEPIEEFATTYPDIHHGLWSSAPLCTTTTTTTTTSSDTTTANATCVFDDSSESTHETTQSYRMHYSEQVEDFPLIEHDDLPLDSLLNENQELLLSQKPGFSPFLIAHHVQNRGFNRKLAKRRLNAKEMNYADLRCDQCGKTFTAKKRLMSHQSVHTGAKPFSCRTCGKMFSRQDNCVRHERSHR
ncbi:zinc finger protein mnm-2 isoform X1 [Periophthalmus magnuspinnatus]|uniref:zinc finger protein mnm-2 isoform X1 n=1 Tax=Periophthalmus magnuspinnatus TaxID=409849 RepID=UPI0024365CA5|nr:zinc finger protein mnm-2 isoform X1 [Periophthalmus magnuspinnatus]